jgi:hypothetical protein
LNQSVAMIHCASLSVRVPAQTSRWVEQLADGPEEIVLQAEQIVGRVEFVVLDDPSSPAEYELEAKGTIHASFSPRPHVDRFLTPSHTGQIDVWQFARGIPAKLASLNHGETAVGNASFSGDGTRVISLGNDGVYKVWDTGTREIVASYR